MAYQTVRKPPILDETGKDLVAAVEDLKDVLQPTNIVIDLDVSIPANGWSNSAPYRYTWTSDQITSTCAVEVKYLQGAENTVPLYISCEKVAGGVQFESPIKPTQAIPVRVRVINAKAESITAVTDEMVSTSTTSGASNVKQALTKVNSDIGTLSEQIGTLNSKFATITGTLPAVGSNSDYQYPSGFTDANTIICGLTVNNGTVYITPWSSGCGVDVKLLGSVIRLTPTGENVGGKQFRLFIAK